jgi:hypothetical protein
LKTKPVIIGEFRAIYRAEVVPRTNMNTQNESSSHESSSRKGSAPAVALLAGAGVLIAGGFAWQEHRTSDLAKQIATTNQEKAMLQAKLDQADSAWQSAMKSMQAELDESRAQNKTLVTDTDRQARRRSDAFTKQQMAQNKALNEELERMRSSNQEASAKLEGITSEVGSVKDDVGAVKSDVGTVHTDVEATKTDLKDARAELLRVKGDLGEMSGLIATNSTQIQFLKDLGDRNIYEFTLSKDANQKVGDVQLTLKKADVKRNRYTMAVVADDKHVDKKDRTVNEPVQFYTSKAKQPYEIVVNTVQKDKVTGYLATPKVTLSRATTGTK